MGRVDVQVEPEEWYGPDCGEAFDIIPHTRDASRLYPARVGRPIPLGLRAGHRVWALVSHATTTGRHPFATVVTEVLSIAPDRAYAVIQPVTGLQLGSAAAPLGTSALDLRVFRWGSAGPLTQGVIDAIFALFDGLGPGSYPIAPKGPGYVQRFWGATLATPLPESELSRWPPEGRRWSSGLRGSALTSALLGVRGVRRVELGRLTDDLLDYDPAPLMTLALHGVLARYI